MNPNYILAKIEYEGFKTAYVIYEVYGKDQGVLIETIGLTHLLITPIKEIADKAKKRYKKSLQLSKLFLLRFY